MAIKKRFYETKTRYIDSSFKGVPKLENTYGSLNNLLKEMLTKPYNQIESTLGIESFEDTLLIKLPPNHGLEKDQVISILNHPVIEINKEFRIISSEITSITIVKPKAVLMTPEDLNAPFIIQGCPLGYEIVFENLDSGVICFKNKSINSPGILKVIDKIPPNEYLESWSKYARVSIGVEIDDNGRFINNFKSPYHKEYPYVEETGDGVKGASGIHGFAKWTYSLSSKTAPREIDSPIDDPKLDWILIGDNINFYLMIKTTGVVDDSAFSYDLVGFGNFCSYNEKEIFNLCLQAKDGFMRADDTNYLAPTRPRSYFGSLDSDYSGFILTDSYGANESNYGRVKSYGNYISTNNRDTPWDSTHIKVVTPGAYIHDRILLKDFYNFIRGHYRGISILYGDTLPDRYVIQNKMAVRVQQPQTTTTLSKATMLFDLTDWEEIN